MPSYNSATEVATAVGSSGLSSNPTDEFLTMKPKKIRGGRLRKLDVGHVDWLDDDIYDEEIIRPEPDYDDEDETGAYESRFNVARWYEDIAQRSSHRNRIRQDDIKRGTWRSMEG